MQHKKRIFQGSCLKEPIKCEQWSVFLQLLLIVVWNLEMSQPEIAPIDWERLRGKMKSICVTDDIIELFSQPIL